MQARHSLLLVDDDRLVLSSLSHGLKKAGYAVNTAESADEAEAMLDNGITADLAILDVRMPGRSGLELSETLHSERGVPFMLLTAYSDIRIADEAAACGALGYLVKPVDMPQLVPAVEAAIARAQDLSSLKETGRQLQKALDADRSVSVAIGITMMQYRVSHDRAFELLRTTARSQRRKLADLAAEIVKAAETLNLDAHTHNPS